MDWAAYRADAATAAAGKTYTEALAALCMSIIKETSNPVEHKDPRFKKALARFPKPTLRKRRCSSRPRRHRLKP